MPINPEEVRYIAKLAKLSFTEEECTQMAKELEAIVGYVEQLKEVNVEDIPATSHVLDLSNVFREDKAMPGMPVEELMQNAPAHKMGYFSVPKVIG